MGNFIKNGGEKRIALRVLAAFICTATITTGATFCLVAADSGKSSDGNVVIEYITGGTLRIDGLTLNGKGVSGGTAEGADIVFDSVAGDNEGRVRWSGTGGENLTISVSGTVLNASSLDGLYFSVGLPQSVITAAESEYVDIDAYYDFEEGCSRKIEVEFDPSDIVTGSDGISRLEFSFDITFGWGECFRGDNPSIYYDTEYTDENGLPDKSAGIYISDEQMLSTLEELSNILSRDGQNYKIKIMATSD